MKHLFLLLSSLSLVYAAAYAEQDKFAPLPSYKASTQIDVRGLLVWTSEKQTITECETGRVYRVRILDAVPFFQLARETEELALRGAETVIAQLRGGVVTDLLAAPESGKDGALYVSEIISVERGDCNDE